MPKADMPIIVLAAGASSRMRGRDKLLEPVDGAPLLRQQACKALAATCGSVIVTLPPAPHPRIAALAGLDVQICTVSGADEGMNASLRAGLRQVPDTARHAMVLLSDLPDLTDKDLEDVIAACRNNPNFRIWRGQTAQGAPGHPIIFHADLFPALDQLKGDDGGRPVVAAQEGHVFLVPLPGTRARRDLDTPKDWALWRQENPER